MRFAAAILIVLAGFVVLDTVSHWGKVYDGVSIGEVYVGGMTEEQAAAAVEATYAGRLDTATATIYASAAAEASGGNDAEESSEETSASDAAAQRTKWTVVPSSLQGHLDSDGLAQQALQVGRDDGGLFARISAQFSGWTVDPFIDFNPDALESLAASVDASLGNPRVNWGVTVIDGVAGVTAGHDGYMIDRTWLASQLSAAFLAASSDSSIVAELSYAPLQIDQAEAAHAADLINNGIAQGVHFSSPGSAWDADAPTVGKWIKTTVEQDGESYHLVPSVDEGSAKADLLAHLRVSLDGNDLRVKMYKSSSTVMIQINETGTMPLASDAVDQMNATLFTGSVSSMPSIDVQSADIPSTMSLQAAIDYGIVSRISSYTTTYTANAANRNTNIHLAADLIDDSVVSADGGSWSFNQTAGECNAEKGFLGAGVIEDGDVVDEIGGGICQVATTVFNAVYQAGYPVTERHNHTLYIASYPDGLDAAVSWPDLDLKWQNDGSSDVALQTSYTDTSLTVSLWGVAPGYTVSTAMGDWQEGDRYQVETKTTTDLAAGTSSITQSGANGKSITVTRTVKGKNGQLLHTDVFNSVYSAKNEIITQGGTSNTTTYAPQSSSQ